jgi:hypothetical protein
MAGSTRWGCTQHDGKHGQQYEQHRRKGWIATAATRHDVSPPSAREIERTSLVKTNLLAANDWTRPYHPPARVTGLETEPSMLVRLDKEHTDRRVAERWEDYYVRELVGHFSSS